jgi:hypothetical protein
LAQAAQRCEATLVIATHDARVQATLELLFIHEKRLHSIDLLPNSL